MSPKRKFRMTRQRQVILEEIKKVHTHPTADQLYEMARRRLPHISLGTVYRNLEILSECGMVQKLDLGGAQRRFDGNTKKHYHVHCTRCGHIDDVPIETVVKIQTTFQGASNYKITGHKLELLGLCPQCKKEKKALTKRRGEGQEEKVTAIPERENVSLTSSVNTDDTINPLMREEKQNGQTERNENREKPAHRFRGRVSGTQPLHLFRQ